MTDKTRTLFTKESDYVFIMRIINSFMKRLFIIFLCMGIRLNLFSEDAPVLKGTEDHERTVWCNVTKVFKARLTGDPGQDGEVLMKTFNGMNKARVIEWADMAIKNSDLFIKRHWDQENGIVNIDICNRFSDMDLVANFIFHFDASGNIDKIREAETILPPNTWR